VKHSHTDFGFSTCLYVQARTDGQTYRQARFVMRPTRMVAQSTQ